MKKPNYPVISVAACILFCLGSAVIAGILGEIDGHFLGRIAERVTISRRMNAFYMHISDTDASIPYKGGFMDAWGLVFGPKDYK